MKAWLNRAQSLALATAVAVVVGACSEQLDSGIACPALCPQLPTAVRDTTLFAVAVDTSIAGFPALGNEPILFIASFGDTLQTRGVVRFDTLFSVFRRPNSAEDSAIVFVDTGAVVKLRLAVSDTLAPPTTVEIYDVDVPAADADPTAVRSAFTPDRLLGSQTFATGSLKDSISIPINPDKLLAKIQATAPANRLRIGIRATSAGSASLSVASANRGSAPIIVFRPSPDTTVARMTLTPESRTPEELITASDLADYLVVVTPSPEPANNVIRVGGLPGRRAYLRFDIPTRILDSSSVVRATLLLTQRPAPMSPEAGDSVAVQHLAVVASPIVRDISRALLILTATTLDSVRMLPADSAVRAFEMIRIVRAWRNTDSLDTPRALALRTTTESQRARQVDFFSLEAPIEVRPRLRITYVPEREGRLP